MAAALGGAALIIACLGAAEYATGVDLGIDQVLAWDPGDGGTSSAGRMSPITALNIALLGVAALGWNRRLRGVAVQDWFAVAVMANLLAPAAGYLYEARTLYQASAATAIAPHTIGVLLLLAVGILLQGGAGSLLAAVMADTVTGLMLRQFIPLVALLPVALGYARLAAQRAGLFGLEVGLALYATTNVLCLTAFVAIASVRMSRLERAREASAREASRRQEELATTLNSIGDAVICTDPGGRIVRMNPVAELLTGWRLPDALGRLLPEVFHIVDHGSRELCPSPVDRVLQHDEMVELTAHTDLVARDDVQRPIAASAAPIRHDGQLMGVVVVFRDVSERERAERHAEDQARLLRSVIESIGDGVAVVDETGKVLVWNPAAESMMHLGASDTAPSHWSAHHGLFLPDGKTLYPEDQLPLVRAMRGEYCDRVEVFVRNAARPDGMFLSVTARPLLRGHRPSGGVAVFRDVTDERARNSQLIESERLASVGTLAAGVAHEINNPLSAVIANLDIGIEDLQRAERTGNHAQAWPTVMGALGDAKECADRIRFIVRDLRVFSRADEDLRQPIDVHRVLDSCTRMAWNEVRHRARLEKEYRAAIPTVHANEARLGQVFLNLLVNAAQAIPEGHADEHCIWVRTSNPNDSACSVEIEDTGGGIPAEVMERLFTPFVTTKPAAVGTGLGLSICHRIVQSLGGLIWAENVGRGTRFTVLLPMSQKHHEAATVETTVRQASSRGAVLVVDDERVVGQTIKRGLTEHDVTTVTSGADALSLFREGRKYDVVFCDLMMPNMTCAQFHTELAKVSPEHLQRIVFLTGGAFTPAARLFLDNARTETIDKPFDINQLRDLVARRVGAGV
ncbi:MAG: ATP-binding protein [Myxococcota bacterium]